MRKKVVVLLGIFFLLTACRGIVHAASPLKPDRLTCEYIVNPLGIDVQKPRLSWQLVSGERAQRQTAYEVIVSNNSTVIQSGKGNVWQSGKIQSGQSLHIEYNGAPLKPFTRYYWRVKVYDAKGEASEWSAPAFFETAMLRKDDWQAKWIGDERKQFQRDEDFYKDDPMPLFRKEFNATKRVAAARLYISGLGYYEAYLNGQKIGDHVLDPRLTA